MPPLLVTVLVLQVVIHLVNTVGAATINNLLWVLFNRMPTATSGAVEEQLRLQREVLKIRTEMNNTSSQDQFAKWAKLRRQHDKALAEFEKLSSSVSASKASFDNSLSITRWLSTNGLRFFLQFWYAKQALFWLPKGWFPSYIEWLLAFPRAPTGSVSIQVWGMACASAIQLVTAVVMAVAFFLMGSKKPIPLKSATAGGSAPPATEKPVTGAGGKEL